ncbi:MAG TPA: tripartite tricarboxylate transporter substrate-binding protein [Alphaproteobacteria bacterium]|nr:tripartite tricarboxylate transporter substrate-binding protein [Alphaproteobacteria bacterium]
MKASAYMLACACLLAAGTASVPAAADPVADFYKGKQMQFVIRSNVGGGYDQYSRLLGRHIVKHIPGTPTMLPVNMPGGGGLQAANFIAQAAPKDGTYLTMVSQGLPMDQALGLNKGLQADMKSFNWIGNMSDSNQLTVTWHTSPTKTIEDAMNRETVIGATGAGSISTQVPAVLNNVVGTKFKVIFGYPGGADINLAMERGEIEGRATNPWASYVSVTPHYVAEKKINILVQTGMKKDKDLPNVPLMRELAKTPEQKAILDYISKAVAVGRPVGTTPGVPQDRVAALRKAFDATLADPAFVAEADKQKMEISAMNGEELQQIIADIIDAPIDLLEKVRLVTHSRDAKELPGAKASE